ncbi:competence protein ComEC [Nakamurella sp. UYEF19]|uniref:ComEC/Rec2 family competence protein n=1 Tax=Nakamurella sp. UYEF19 TaxID=1756392 RepID=UPI00339489F4
MGRRWVEEDTPPPLDLRLVPTALAVWAGALVGLSGVSWIGPAVIAGAAAFGGSVAVALHRRGVVWWSGWLAVCAGFVAALTISALDWHFAEHNPLTIASAKGSWAVVEITIGVAPQQIASRFPAADAAPNPDGSPPGQWLVSGHADLASIADTEFEPAMDISLMATGDRWAHLVPGERIRAAGLLTPDDYSILPGVTLKARSGPEMLARAPWWHRAGATVRERLVRSASGLSPDAKGLLPGLVVGNTDGIPPDLAADAKVTGLTHLLAVSGSHFALLCGLAVLLLRGAGPRIAAAGGAVVVIGLIVLVGPGPSVLRAAVMGSIALLAMSVGRNRTALPALAAAAILLLLYDPTLARSVGFALSVQATAGLILLAPVWSKALQRRGWPAGFADLLAVPVAAHVATMPVIAALSGAVSLASIPANLLAAPVVPPALVIGMAAALLGPWWPGAARSLAGIDQPLLEWIAFVAHRLASWQSASLPWPASVPGVLALAGLLMVGMLILRHRKVRALLLAVVVGAAMILVPAQVISVGWPPPDWVLTACEVGQGDGMVLSTGEPGTGVVVDAGPDPDLIDACLTRLGISTVPLIVLTHLHADHVDGLAGVLAGRSVGAIGVGPDRDAPPAWRKINQLAAAQGVPVVGLPKGTTWGSGALRFEVLGPEGAFRGTDSDENNDSVVLMAQIAGIRILMTGDIENEAQQQLLDDRVDLRADVMEQPHHGSAKVLPAFVAAVHPTVSAIGVGLGNDYGQPSPKALAQLTAIGTTILRTDLQGDAVVCVKDGRISTVTRGAFLTEGSGKGGSGDGA